MKKTIRVFVLNVLSICMLLYLFPLIINGQAASTSARKSGSSSDQAGDSGSARTVGSASDRKSGQGDKSQEAPLNPGFLKFLKFLEAGDRPLYDNRNGATMLESPVSLAHVKGRGNLYRSGVHTYPSGFDLRQSNKLTPVRYQGDCGSGWAYAAFASLESYLKPSQNLDFSELHLIRNHGFDYDECYGGNPWMAAAYLTRWDGPLYETDDNSAQERKHVQQMMFLPGRSDSLDNDHIKYFISNVGAVYGRLDWDFDYYESAHASYYCNQDTVYVLPVALVGWDDNFSRQNFKNIPPADGAFIAKVSFGTWWGDNGYIYVSYYDTGLTRLAMFNSAESINNYNHIYQYDRLGWTNSRGYSNSTTAWGANIFTASADETLKAVSFYTNDTAVDYDIYIYKNIYGNLPDEGTQVASISGKKDYPGYYTQKLSTAVSLSAGERFSVVIRFANSSYGYPVATEQPVDNFSSKATAEPGQSFISSSGQGWYDLDTDNKNINVTIKAFTIREGGGVTLPEAPSFGSFDSPANGSTVRGSIAVTGWALDSSGLSSVKIYMRTGSGLSYIGDAMFVEGARPDVAAAYPDYPNCTRAGWGYMLLSNFLPNKGNGTFELHAIAVDTGGRETSLGTKTIYCDNANATEPFGAIDTPAQGGTASGSKYINWGWALTPQPNKIPVDGSTIDVVVDGVKIGHPTYNVYRSDIADFFPSYANSQGAIGYFSLDTTKYENGRHTIEWQVTDNAGNKQGIGSRFFYVANDNSGFTGNLEDDVIQYTGEFGEPCFIPYVRDGDVVEVEAFPGQVIVVFKESPTLDSAHDLIQSKGGYILAQVPALGYYLVGVESGQESFFIEGITSDSRLWLAVPHIAGDLKSIHPALIPDDWKPKTPNTLSHGEKVRNVLVKCGGKAVDAKLSLAAFGPVGNRVKSFMADKDFIAEVKKSITQKKPLLVNLSAAAGAPPCTDWRSLGKHKKTFENSWKSFVEVNLTIIHKLIEKYPFLSDNIVYTIAAGNENMTLDESLKEIRKDKKLAKILDRNVMILTSSDKICGGKLNGNGYNSTDDAVAIVDNKKATGGTSYSAPCAMGNLQRAIERKNLSPVATLVEFRRAVKKNNRVWDESVVKKVFSVDGNYVGTYQEINIIPKPGCTLNAAGKFTVEIKDNKVTCSRHNYNLLFDPDTCTILEHGVFTNGPDNLNESGGIFTVEFSYGATLTFHLNGDRMKGKIIFQDMYSGYYQDVNLSFSVLKQ